MGPNIMKSKIKQNLEDSKLEPKVPKAKASAHESDEDDYKEAGFEEDDGVPGEDPLDKLRKALNKENQ